MVRSLFCFFAMFANPLNLENGSRDPLNWLSSSKSQTVTVIDDFHHFGLVRSSSKSHDEKDSNLCLSERRHSRRG